MQRWIWIAVVWAVGCGTAPALESPARVSVPPAVPESAPASAAVAQNEAARAMAQQVCGSPHLDAALTALGTRAAELAGLPEGAPELELPELAAAQCLRDLADAPPAAVPGPSFSPMVAALVCACQTARCRVWAARQAGTDPPTAEGRQEAVLCLRGGYRAVLAAQAMEQAVCACPDLACAQRAATETAQKLILFKNLHGSSRDVAAIKAAGAAAAECMRAHAKATIVQTNQADQRPAAQPKPR